MKQLKPDRKPKILVVEDNLPLRNGLILNLELQGYEAISARDGDEGMKMAFDERPDLIVMDITMPGFSGLEIIQELRKRKELVPVLVLSARGRTMDKVTGLRTGADDYMTKPFELPELIARIEVMLRRSRQEAEGAPQITAGGIIIDRAGRKVSVNGRSLDLNAKEFDILLLFAEAPNRVLTRDVILEKVWGWDYEGTARTVDNYITSLRKKMDRGRGARQYIITVPRVGYKLVAES